MRRTARLLSLGLSLLLLFAVFGSALSLSAAGEGDSLTEAIAAVEAVDTETLTDAEYAGVMFGLLFDRIRDHYNIKDAPNEVKTLVGEAINEYSFQIYYVSTDPDSTGRNPAVQTRVRDLALRGLYAGVLAWIYHNNADESLGTVMLANGVTLADYYRYLCENAIGGKEDGYFADGSTAEVYQYFTELFQGIFEAKLSRLSPEESLPDAWKQNVRGLLTQAMFDTRSCVYTAGVTVETRDGEVRLDGEDGYSFRLIYERTLAAVSFAEIFELLYPDHTFGALPRTESLLSALSGKSTPVAVNALLGDTLDGLLSDLSGENTVGNRFTYAYEESLRAQCADIFDAADENKTVAEGDALAPVFAEYPLRLARAAAQDRLDARRAALLENTARYPAEGTEQNRLNALVNAAIAIIDGCDSTEEIALEEARGAARADLYDRYLEAVEEIEGYLNDSAELLDDAELAYNEANNAIGGAATVNAVEAALREGEAALRDQVAEAEAEAYRIDHAEILDRITYTEGVLATDSLTVADLSALEEAIRDAASDRLSELAREKLTDTLKGVGEAYRYVSSELAKDLLENEKLTDPNDPLYVLNEDAADRVVEEILNTPVNPDDLSELKERVEGILEEVEAIRDVIDHVTDDIREAEQYDQYAPEYTERIEGICRETVEKILDAERTETAEKIRDGAILDAERQEALAQVDLAAKEREEITGVPEAIEDAEDRILNEAETVEDLEEIVAETTHEIDRLETVSEIQTKTEETKDAIEELPYLSEEEKQELIEKTEQVRDEQIGATENAQNRQELDQVVQNTENAMEEIRQDATATDLENGREQITEEITERADEIEEIINGYEYMDEEERQELIGELNQAEREALENLGGCTDTESLEQTRDEHRGILDSLEAEADRREAEDCREQIREDLNGVNDRREDYSEERFEEILDILDSAEERLDGADTIEDYLAIQEETKAAIDAVPDRLDEAQADAAERLNDAYNELMENKNGYTEENRGAIEEIYTQTEAQIQGYTEIAQIEEMNTLTEERISMMREVLLNRIFTADRLLASDTLTNVSYDPWANGYFGSLTSAIGLNTGSALHIYDVLLDGVAERIMQAAKSNRIVDRNGVLLSKELNRLFRNCYVTTGLDVTLGEGILKAGDSYELSVLLPDGTFLDHVIGVVFLCEDGSVEYYELTREGMLVTFSTNHFSEYYIVSAHTVNLVPIIVIMALILVAEIVILARLYLRKSRRGKEAAVLPAALFNPYRPEGAWNAITLMGIAIVLLAGWILILLLTEHLAKRRANAPVYEPLLVEGPALECLPEPVPEPEEVPVEEPETEEEPEAEPEEDQVIQVEEKEMVERYEDPESYTGTRRGAINLDTLSDHFTSGETVTLNSMKALRLVPNNVGSVKVLARGQIDCPMTVVAQGFSASARQAILEAGGEPIVTEPSAERTGRKRS